MISTTKPLKKFLTARWHNLVMANYMVAPELLQDFLPTNVELDFWNNECYVSLVAFEFLGKAEPKPILPARGSEISVYKGAKIIL